MVHKAPDGAYYALFCVLLPTSPALLFADSVRTSKE